MRTCRAAAVVLACAAFSSCSTSEMAAPSTTEAAAATITTGSTVPVTTEAAVTTTTGTAVPTDIPTGDPCPVLYAAFDERLTAQGTIDAAHAVAIALYVELDARDTELDAYDASDAVKDYSDIDAVADARIAAWNSVDDAQDAVYGALREYVEARDAHDDALDNLALRVFVG